MLSQSRERKVLNLLRQKGELAVASAEFAVSHYEAKNNILFKNWIN